VEKPGRKFEHALIDRYRDTRQSNADRKGGENPCLEGLKGKRGKRDYMVGEGLSSLWYIDRCELLPGIAE
jgi:hypothetical protein